MEYFVGALATLVAVFVTRIFTSKELDVAQKIQVSYSQSNVYEIVRPFIPKNLSRKVEPTQSTKHYDKLFTKIFFQNNKAYWIKDNTFFVADMIDGMVDRENAKPVDIMGMDKVQLNEMIFIIEILTEGSTDDYRNSR
jgi:hypothetical protein